MWELKKVFSMEELIQTNPAILSHCNGTDCMIAACIMWFYVPSDADTTQPTLEEDSRSLSELCYWKKSSHGCLMKGKRYKQECLENKSCKAIFNHFCQTMEETELFQKYFPDKTIGIDDNPYKYNKCTV